MTRPSRARCSSVGRVSACQAFPVASYSASRRLDAVSSGPTTRKSRRSAVAAMTASSRPPSTRVGSWRTVPGLSTCTACSSRAGDRQIAQQQPAVGVRGGAEPRLAFRHTGEDLVSGASLGVEEFIGPVRAQPALQLPQVLRVVADPGQRDLVGAPGALDGQSVDLGGPGPALGGTQHDHGPARPSGLTAGPGGILELPDAVDGAVHRGGHRPVHREGVVPRHVQGLVTVAAQQGVEFRIREAGEHGRVGDLVAVEVEDGKDGPVMHGIEELVGVPRTGERSGLRLAVTDDAGDQQVRVVECGAVCVGQGVAQFAALVDGAGVSGATWLGTPPGKENCLNSSAIPAASLLTSGYVCE